MNNCVNIDPDLAFMLIHPWLTLLVFFGSYVLASFAAEFVKAFVKERRRHRP